MMHEKHHRFPLVTAAYNGLSKSQREKNRMQFCLSLPLPAERWRKGIKVEIELLFIGVTGLFPTYMARHKQNKTITVNCPASAQFIHSRNWLLDIDCQIFFCSIFLSFRVGLVRTKKKLPLSVGDQVEWKQLEMQKSEKTWRVYVTYKRAGHY